MTRVVSAKRAATAAFHAAPALPPRVRSAHVPVSALDTIEVTMTEATTATSIAGVTAVFTSGTARTVTGVKSGSGTTKIVLQLDGSTSVDDVFDVKFASSQWKDADGNKVPDCQVAALPIAAANDLTSETWEVASDVGATNVAAGTWTDQSSHGVTTQSAGTSPTYVASPDGYDGISAVKCVAASSQALLTTAGFPISTFFPATASWLECVAVPDSFPTNAAASYQNSGFVGHGYCSIFTKGTSDNYKVGAYNFSSADDHCEVACEQKTPFSVQYKLASNVLYIRRGLGVWASVASATRGSTAGALSLGKTQGPGAQADGKMLSVVAASVVPATSAMEDARARHQERRWNLLPRFNIIPRLDAIVGKQMYCHLEGGILVDDPYNGGWSLSISGGYGSISGWVWTFTPASGDVGSHPVTISLSRGGRVIAQQTVTLNVYPATTFKALRIWVAAGDSTWATASFSNQLKAELDSMYLGGVTMIGDFVPTGANAGVVTSAQSGQSFNYARNNAASPLWVSGAFDIAAKCAALGGAPDVGLVGDLVNDIATTNPDNLTTASNYLIDWIAQTMGWEADIVDGLVAQGARVLVCGSSNCDRRNSAAVANYGNANPPWRWGYARARSRIHEAVENKFGRYHAKVATTGGPQLAADSNLDFDGSNLLHSSAAQVRCAKAIAASVRRLW